MHSQKPHVRGVPKSLLLFTILFPSPLQLPLILSCSSLLVRPPWLLLCFCPTKLLVILLLHVPHCYIATSSPSAISSLDDAHLPTVRDSEGESPSLEVIRSGFARHSSVGQSDTCWRARSTAVSRCFLTGGQFGSRQVFPFGC